AWADLPPDILGAVIARLPHPGDRARICAACRAWRSAACPHVRHQPPWLVLPDCSFCTTGRDGAFFPRIPGLPDNATCLAAAGAGWLALDCTDDVFRRTPTMDNFCYEAGMFVVNARPDIKHRHTYMLHNPFSNITVPLPELDDIIGHVAETFEVRKVLMRSSTNPADLVAVTTSSSDCNIILCRPGKGAHVLPHFRVIDVAFLGDILYGITSGEELVASHLGEDDDDGRPQVTRFRLDIRNPMADYYKKHSWIWPADDTISISDYYDKDGNEEPIDDEDEAPNQDEDGDEEENQEEEDDDLAAANLEEEEVDSSFNGHVSGSVSDNDVKEYDEEVPYEPKDEVFTTRFIVQSQNGDELLLVRHQMQSPPYSDPYTRKVEIFKADFMAGKWVTVNGLAKGEALFLTRSLSKSARAHGDIEDGFVYSAAGEMDDVFDTRSWRIRHMRFRWPWQRKKVSEKLLTWLFPPEVVV
ncbi:hypothetical protein PVAP13_6NG009600, partial [Panicum virgatum]